MDWKQANESDFLRTVHVSTEVHESCASNPTAHAVVDPGGGGGGGGGGVCNSFKPVMNNISIH